MLPISFGISFLILGGLGVVIVLLMGIYVLFAITLSGFVIVKVVEFMGWKKKGSLRL